MTISHRELCQTATDSILKPERFFPCKIPVHHHQLRHLLSVADGERVFYVSDFDVYVLDIVTQQSVLLATVPFSARCLAADHGYVCVGGDSNGDCAFIHLENLEGGPKCFGHDLNVDVLGGEIVNSMNIHLLRDEPDSLPEPVALISNNDRTVKIFSLARREVLTSLLHDAPMNYAAVSPDSTLLATVGDTDKVYFYKRCKIEQPTRDETSFTDFRWRPFVVPVVPTGDTVDDDYAFAVTFSPSGHLCAASSQGGAITVIDVDRLMREDGKPEDAILCTFRSSRPMLWGCVRSMAFSPQPWDLLAWAEDHGRVGVADLRQMFIRRQVLPLDKDGANVVQLQDMTPEPFRQLSTKEKLKQQHLTRLRSLRRNADLSPETDRRLAEIRVDSWRRQRRQYLLSYHRGLELDARERSVLQALETTIDDVRPQPQPQEPYSLNYISEPRFRASATDDMDPEVQLLNPEARYAPRMPQPPRRRTSVILSEPNASHHLVPSEILRSQLSASPGRITDDEDVPATSTSDLTPTRGSSSQPYSYNTSTSDPWSVLQNALEEARQQDAQPQNTQDSSRPTSLTQIEAALNAERRLGVQLERQLEDERQLSTLLRSQLDTQERLIQSQQREIQAEREAEARLEPSVERLLRRELQSEQQFGEHRSQEIETEIRLGSTRARRLESERQRLLTNISPSTQRSSSSSPMPSTSSAQTSTLPTTLTSTNTSPMPTSLGLPSLAPTNMSTDNLTLILQRHEAFRRQRMAHIENLERQVRRAESRVASASSDIQALESAVQRGAFSERLARQSQAREISRARAHAGELDAPSASASNGATAVNGNGETSRPTRRSITELSNRPISESEMRLARMMFVSGGSSVGGLTRRGDLDANGNWVSGGGLRRMLDQARAGVTTNGGADGGVSGRASVSDVVREMGIGTAGLGWSDGGRMLYVGTEEGVFEFRLNVKDRMAFPSIEMR